MSRGCISVDRRVNRPAYSGDSSTSAGACVVWPSNRRIGGSGWRCWLVEFEIVEFITGGGAGNAMSRGPFVVFVVNLNVSGFVLDIGSRVIVDIRALRKMS